MRLLTLEAHLLNPPSGNALTGISRFTIELLYFGVKEARACLFVGLFF